MGTRSSLLPDLNLSLSLYCLLLLSGLALLFLVSPATAQSDLSDSYDENTELTVRGSVVEAKRETPGPFVIKLRHKNRIYHVVTAPPWYLARQELVLREGLELDVTGSKYYGKDGTPFLLARQITDLSTGKVITLRDSLCRPLWHGHRMQRGRTQ